MRRRAWFIETLREWGWRHTGLGLLVGTLALSNMGGFLSFGPDFPWLRSWVYNIFELGFPYVFALRVADRAVADGAPRWLTYGVVAVGVVATGVWVIGPLLYPILGGDPEWGSANDWVLFCTLLLPYSIATVAYAHWRRGQDTLERVQAAEMARARQEQLVQSSRLLTLQARVEPQFLFDTLQRVRELIGSSAQAAERLLTDLIALLRAMQPQAGATASTVEREFALVEAYGRASESRALLPPALMLAAAEPAPRARFAPLVLLPTLRRLAGDAPDARWQVGALRQGERLRVAITPTATLDHARLALQTFDARAFCERMTAVHGPGAALAVDAAGPAPALHIDMPFQPRDDNTTHDPSPDR
jgi:Histidine kinase